MVIRKCLNTVYPACGAAFAWSPGWPLFGLCSLSIPISGGMECPPGFLFRINKTINIIKYLNTV